MAATACRGKYRLMALDRILHRNPPLRTLPEVLAERNPHATPQWYEQARAREIVRRQLDATDANDRAAELLDSALTCLERGDAIDCGSMMFYHFSDEAERLVEQAGALLTGLLKERAGIVAEHIVTSRMAYPSGYGAIGYVRELRDAVKGQRA